MNATDYAEFLTRKRPAAPKSGHDCGEIHERLFDFQGAIVRWAALKGRAAIFADCGMGKTLMQLEWIRQLATHHGRPSLIVAPLGVCEQTVAEALTIGMPVAHVTEPTDDPVQITNYERLSAFESADYGAIVLDESSILKSITSKTRGRLIAAFSDIPYRLCCTATPAPNDITELGNHAEFLGVLTHREMSSTFFVNDTSDNTTPWRLKGHARNDFFRWLASWSVYIRKPSDIGFSDEGWDLPPLTIVDHVVPCDVSPGGMLFPTMAGGIQGRTAARRTSIDGRIDAAVDIINSLNGHQAIVWCGLNDEGRRLQARLSSSVLCEGSQTEQEKAHAAHSWIAGDFQTLITKPRIHGFGMNFQHCARSVFLGIGDSYEQYYQAIRRLWRFGQTEPVEAHIIVSDIEAPVIANVRRKEREALSSAQEVVSAMKDYEKSEVAGAAVSGEDYDTHDSEGLKWSMKMGDSVERLAEVETDSVGLSVFSPPFVSLYTYTATARDLGNSRGTGQFFEHFGLIIAELLRTTAPGRLCCCHVAQVPAMLSRDGFIGMKDFRADTVAAFTAAGWIYHGECVIDKDPQAQAIRTKSKSLLFVQLRKDASWLRPALADYILVFRKPGENQTPIKPDLTNEEWIQWARPIWYGISESDTLQFRHVRANDDDRHICPLQLGTIERCIRLWSNPDDLVLSPFAGIGSEGVMAVRLGRRFVGIELKPEYYRAAVSNLDAESKKRVLF